MNFEIGDLIVVKDCSVFPAEYIPNAIGEVITLNEYAHWTDGNEQAISVRWITGKNEEQCSVVTENNAIKVDAKGKPIVEKTKHSIGKRIMYEF